MSAALLPKMPPRFIRGHIFDDGHFEPYDLADCHDNTTWLSYETAKNMGQPFGFVAKIDGDRATVIPETRLQEYAEMCVAEAAKRKQRDSALAAFDNTPFAASLPAGANVVQFPGAPAPTQTALPAIMSFADFVGVPPEMKWLAEGLIPEGFITDLSAKGGTGKSYLAVQLGIARATGSKWLGKETKPGKTIVFAAEDTKEEMHRRAHAVCKAVGTSLPELRDFYLLPMFGHDTRLMKAGFEASPVFAHVEASITATGADLVIIDTRADAFNGNENDRAEVVAFMRLLKRLTRDGKVTVLLISHPSRTGEASDGQSGSTAWTGSVRSRLVMERKDDRTTLRVEKANYGSTRGALALEYRNGCFAVVGDESDPDYLVETNDKVDKRFLELLAAAHLRGENISTSTNANNSAAVVFHKHDKSISKDHYREAMARLMDARKIKVESYKSEGKERSRLTTA